MTAALLACGVLLVVLVALIYGAAARAADELARVRYLLTVLDQRDRERDERERAASGNVVDLRPIR
jgi:hypothetical protein